MSPCREDAIMSRGGFPSFSRSRQEESVTAKAPAEQFRSDFCRPWSSSQIAAPTRPVHASLDPTQKTQRTPPQSFKDLISRRAASFSLTHSSNHQLRAHITHKMAFGKLYTYPVCRTAFPLSWDASNI